MLSAQERCPTCERSDRCAGAWGMGGAEADKRPGKDSVRMCPYPPPPLPSTNNIQSSGTEAQSTLTVFRLG